MQALKSLAAVAAAKKEPAVAETAIELTRNIAEEFMEWLLHGDLKNST